MIPIQRERTPLQAVMYGLYLYFLGLSFRDVSRALARPVCQQEPHSSVEVGSALRATPDLRREEGPGLPGGRDIREGRLLRGVGLGRCGAHPSVHPRHPPFTAPEHDRCRALPQEPRREVWQARSLLRRRDVVPRGVRCTHWGWSTGCTPRTRRA